MNIWIKIEKMLNKQKKGKSEISEKKNKNKKKIPPVPIPTKTILFHNTNNIKMNHNKIK